MPRSTVKFLQDLSIESQHVGILNMASAKDKDILDYAIQHDHIIVTLDVDFHTLLARRQSRVPTVIRIRIEGLKGKPLSELLKQVIDRAGDEIESGSALSVTEKGIRVRNLPL